MTIRLLVCFAASGVTAGARMTSASVTIVARRKCFISLRMEAATVECQPKSGQNSNSGSRLIRRTDKRFHVVKCQVENDHIRHIEPDFVQGVPNFPRASDFVSVFLKADLQEIPYRIPIFNH